MKRKNLLIIIFSIMTILKICNSNAQTVRPILNITGSNNCTGGTFTITSTQTPEQITWKKNNITVQTSYAGFANGTLAAGDASGNNGTAQNLLDNPFGLFVDNSGNIYIADQVNNRIQKWAPGATTGVTVAGSPIGTSGTADSLLYSPTGVYVDNSGNIYVADFANSRIQMFRPGVRAAVTVAGSASGTSGSADSLLDYPIAVFLDGSGNLFVSDYDNNRVQKFAPGSKTGVTVANGTATSQLANPSGLYIDINNNLFVADNGNNRILKFVPGNTLGTTVAGDSDKIFGSDAAHLIAPDAIYVDGTGNLYIADVGNNRIQRWAPGATSGATIAGYAHDLQKPQGIYMSNGQLYVSDAGNERILQYSSSLPLSFTGDGPGNYTATVTTYSGATNTISGGTTWIGAVSSDWHTAGNWCSNSVPSANDDVHIPFTAHTPVLTTDSAAVHSIITDSAANIVIDSTQLKVTGPIVTLNGNVTGNGLLLLSSIDTQNIHGKDTIANLKLSNTNGATISLADTINIKNNYYPAHGILNVSGGLVMLSDSNGTAAIGAGTGSAYINGPVTVQQYIHGGRRAFRFLGHPFSETISLSQVTRSLDITGNGGNTNGFTTTETNNPSAFWYNPLTGNGSDTDDYTGWIPVTTIADSGINAWAPIEGIRVMVRGAKGEGLLGQDYTPSATTMVLNGHLNQGTKTVKLIPNSNKGYNFLCNPYPSPIDLSQLVTDDSVGANYWVWDPNEQLQGAYISLPFTQSYVLPAYSSFFVTTRDSMHNTVTFNEGCKTNAPVTGNLFKTTKTTATDNMIQLHVLSPGNAHSWDRLRLYFNTAAQSGVDNLDAHKLYNPDLNFYTFAADQTKLAVDARPYVDGQVIKLGLATSQQGIYSIKADAFAAPAGSHFYLNDKYLNEVHELYANYEYTFQVTGDVKSQGDDRFELNLSASMKQSGSLHVYIVPNPASDHATITYENITPASTTLRITNMLGQEVYVQDLGVQQNGNVTVPVKYLPSGIYLVSMQSGNQVITQQLVKR